jgi:TonB family protein
MTSDKRPRRFGNYLLTADLGEDALGHEFRARRIGDSPGFVRLRMLDAPELSRDALYDAIEANGEIHGFLKNPAVARGVDMDAAEGVPFVAWNEPNGRTLADLQRKCREAGRRIPAEHALLIAEKIATALDHAYNTTIDGDRTLHGLVWPGFVAISDDGDIRLAGFGLAPGVLPAIDRPRLASEVGPYLAEEERRTGEVGRNSDVFSLGVLLLELLTGQPPPADPLAVVKGTAGEPPPLQPEILSLLKMTLAPAESRYGSSGDLRRELGKLLFSGPYSPSTFNLAYFLNDQFREEIEAETRARKRESALDAGGSGGRTPVAEAPAPSASAAAPPGPPIPPPATRRALPEPEPPPAPAPPPRRPRLPARLVGGFLAGLAVAGGVYVVSRKTPAASAVLRADRAPTPAPTRTLLPELQPTPSGPTTGMSEEQFLDEVSRRVALETQRLEAEMRARQAAPPARLSGGPVDRPAAPEAALIVALAPTARPTPTFPPVVAALSVVVPPPAPTPEPARLTPAPLPASAEPPGKGPEVREGSLVSIEEIDAPPRIATLVKPVYPPLALKARIGGIVVLRVLVSEKGLPLEVQVARKAPAGLDEAAVAAVRRWTFTPALKDGVPVRTWLMVPIPFEP